MPAPRGAGLAVVGEAICVELREVGPIADHVDRAAVEVTALGHVEAGLGEGFQVLGRRFDAVRVEAFRGRGNGRSRDSREGKDDREADAAPPDSSA